MGEEGDIREDGHIKEETLRRRNWGGGDNTHLDDVAIQNGLRSKTFTAFGEFP